MEHAPFRRIYNPGGFAIVVSMLRQSRLNFNRILRKAILGFIILCRHSCESVRKWVDSAGVLDSFHFPCVHYIYFLSFDSIGWVKNTYIHKHHVCHSYLSFIIGYDRRRKKKKKDEIVDKVKSNGGETFISYEQCDSCLFPRIFYQRHNL